ncbi:MAG: hypothetical protein IKJ22_04635 [Paludibacteraceae bacterium]|nr:hypothetical protein [Paludibacteraceae bacterium]
MKKILLLGAALLAAMTASAVTFNVTVPEGTKVCYVVGAPGWAANFVQMDKISDTQYSVETDLIDGTAYKYCAGNDWAYVEKDADGNEITDRAYSENDVVAKWAAIQDPEVATVYNDITINIQASVAPTIWWWGCGSKCPNAQDQGETWPGPTMEAIPGADGWYTYTLSQVQEGLGAFKFVVDGTESAEISLASGENLCLDESGNKATCPEISTDLEETDAEDAVVAAFDITGKPVAADAAGIVILQYASGKAVKVFNN